MITNPYLKKGDKITWDNVSDMLFKDQSMRTTTSYICNTVPTSLRGNNRCLGVLHHRLNMELDLQSLFELYSCTHWLRPLPPHLGSYTRAIQVNQNRRHLSVTSRITQYRKSNNPSREYHCKNYRYRYYLCLSLDIYIMRSLVRFSP